MDAKDANRVASAPAHEKAMRPATCAGRKKNAIDQSPSTAPVGVAVAVGVGVAVDSG